MHLSADETWMAQALELAERGRGLVEPNPLVGAVVVRAGRLVGEGWHQQFGGPHAEIFALEAAGEQARGATLYVSLEPCCHFGKTPPCTEAILRAGITRVVAAMRDPFPQVDGGGFQKLRQAGIDVVEGVCLDKARRINAPFLTLFTQARPYVHAKWAMTLDGKIATRTGHSQWISNEASRALVHRLRGRVDGILVGIGTALADDPQLTARPPGPRVATRIILDSTGRLPVRAHLAATAHQVPTLVIVAAATAEENRRLLQQSGCEIVTAPSVNGRPALAEVLAELGRRRLTNLLVEGGGAVLGSFLDAGFIDEVHVFLAPRLLGGAEAKPPMAGLGAATVAEGLQLAEWHVEALADNLYVHGWRG